MSLVINNVRSSEVLRKCTEDIIIQRGNIHDGNKEAVDISVPQSGFYHCLFESREDGTGKGGSWIKQYK